MELSVKQKAKQRENLGIEVGNERNWLEATLDLKPLVFTFPCTRGTPSRSPC